MLKQFNSDGYDGKSGFETDPGYAANTLTIAYLLDPRYAVETMDAWVDVDVSFGVNDGRTLVYLKKPPPILKRKLHIVKRFDNARLFALYVDLMTRPVPVKPEG
ncbi:Inosine-uridine preferring nucleoside hydrolase [Collimonas arenae]|uniref:Inosine-uridine preferring nucleoside hydrolase n=1 Tax=Collimonas arenae TaxID=279058 RepID=A0A0A1FLN6_9BURK|nr:Inosine-uridine preferring nucleoside hydrolase [Collimonas arenae]